MSEVRSLRESVSAEVRKVVVGQQGALDAALAAILVRGHVLLEGVPGIGKTLLVKALSRAVSADFRRIQFTPDVMPSDIVGTNVFDLKSSSFRLSRGPVFTDLLLADEINRTPPKSQAALLEAMEERCVSIDGETHTLSPLFTVFATQNPVEFEGTYPLPEAELDRFLLKVRLDYPTPEEEVEVLRRVSGGLDPHDLAGAGVRSVIGPGHIDRARRVVAAVRVEPAVLAYVRDVVRTTRTSGDLMLGAGPRASVHLLLTAKAGAALAGRDFVTPDDVKGMALPVLRHRLVLEPEAELDGGTADGNLGRLIETVPVPK